MLFFGLLAFFGTFHENPLLRDFGYFCRTPWMTLFLLYGLKKEATKKMGKRVLQGNPRQRGAKQAFTSQYDRGPRRASNTTDCRTGRPPCLCGPGHPYRTHRLLQDDPFCGLASKTTTTSVPSSTSAWFASTRTSAASTVATFHSHRLAQRSGQLLHITNLSEHQPHVAVEWDV